MDHHYPASFYTTSWQRASDSARHVVPLLLALTSARSVVDVGCGVGAWLEIFAESGVSDFLGLDGPHVNRRLLRIPADTFAVRDLSEPLHLDRTFDVAISLEVAEHLPAAAAGRFVDDLTRLAPIVLFSAAVPGQGGTHHVNEQWPEYWEALFKQCGYVVIDCVRPAIWAKPDVEFFYAQNTLLFVKSDELERFPRLKVEAERRCGDPLARIHPRRWMATLDPRTQSLSALLRLFVLALAHRVGVRR